MASKKRNEWLEADIEDDELSNHSDVEEGRGRILESRSNKRRKVESSILSGTEASDYEEEDENEQLDAKSHLQSVINSTTDALLPTAGEDGTPQKRKKSDIERKLTKIHGTSSRSGVIYISHVPPFMKPHTIKNLLSPFAPNGIGRIYLTPEDQDRRQARVRAGGNKKRNFVDGWVEFTSKKEAKAAVETLNTKAIGGKKGGFYFDDVWNLKYLKGFKWRHLTEQITNENEERAARMRAEASRSKKEMREFLRNVEKAKIEETRQQKREKKAQKSGVSEAIDEPTKPKMGFGQSAPILSNTKKVRDGDEALTERVLSQIF
jgi:ESF2/ABP1 family protein